MTIDEALEGIGRMVVYRSFPGAPPEDGKIMAVREPYVMVLYTGDREAKATYARDIEFQGRIVR